MRYLASVSLLALLLSSSAGFAAEDPLAALGLEESAVPARQMPGWAKPKKAVVLVDGPDRLAYYKEVIKDVELIPAGTPAEARKVAAGADVIVGFCDPEAVKAAAKTLTWLQLPNVGVGVCATLPELQDGRVLVTNTQRITASGIGEHVIALMLGLTRGLDRYIVAQQQESFNQRAVAPERVWEVSGKTMLVVGIGGIGSAVATRAHALGMKVIATRNSSRDKPDYISYVGLSDELPTLIGQADVVVFAAPLTPATRGLFNAALFAKMKKSAYFINVGRGANVVQEDLVAALKNGTIAGAAVDVTDPEPLPKGNALWSAPNLIITPHVSGPNEFYGDRLFAFHRENLRRYAAGEKVFSVVDVKKGY